MSVSDAVADRTKPEVSALLPDLERGLQGIERMQSTALALYGRLETDRALVWTLEELGELSQAVRRAEGRARIEEELGQVTAWMLCLANILEVDLADAVQAAVTEEFDRQMRKYGVLKPYVRP
jgi:NTP pyrophosphatase (non-canonical NTP hydrolase)